MENEVRQINPSTQSAGGPVQTGQGYGGYPYHHRPRFPFWWLLPPYYAPYPPYYPPYYPPVYPPYYPPRPPYYWGQ